MGITGLWCSSRARARSCGVSRREAQGRIKHAQAAAVAWWDVPWYVGRTKRHGVGFYSFHDSLKRSSSTPMTKPRGRREMSIIIRDNHLIGHVRRQQWQGASRWCSDSERCQQTPMSAAVTWTIVPWHLHGRTWSMAGQIGHRELVGAIAGTCGVSAPL